jgi:hypothetical protein
MKYNTYADDMIAIHSLLMAGEIDEWEAAQMRMYVSNLAV